MTTRGPKRLAAVTYHDLSRWTGLSLGTIRNHKKELGELDLDGLIRWANARRRRKGLPLIGATAPTDSKPKLARCPDGSLKLAKTAIPADSEPTSPILKPSEPV